MYRTRCAVAIEEATAHADTLTCPTAHTDQAAERQETEVVSMPRAVDAGIANRDVPAAFARNVTHGAELG
jgi:hypothetical protein